MEKNDSQNINWIAFALRLLVMLAFLFLLVFGLAALSRDLEKSFDDLEYAFMRPEEHFDNLTVKKNDDGMFWVYKDGKMLSNVNVRYHNTSDEFIVTYRKLRYYGDMYFLYIPSTYHDSQNTIDPNSESYDNTNVPTDPRYYRTFSIDDIQSVS